MNKLFTKIAGLTLGLAMAIGVGVAVGSKSSDVKTAEAASSIGTASINLGTAAAVTGRWAAGKGKNTTNANSSCDTAWAVPNPDSGAHTYTDTTKSEDQNGQNWTVTFTYTGAYSVSYTGGASGTANMQFGKKNNPATVLKFESSVLTTQMKLTSFSCMYGGAGSGSGNVSKGLGTLYYDSNSLKLGDKISGTNTHTVTWTGEQIINAGSKLMISFSEIEHGFKVYYFSYTFENASTNPTVTLSKSGGNKVMLSKDGGATSVNGFVASSTNITNPVYKWEILNAAPSSDIVSLTSGTGTSPSSLTVSGAGSFDVKVSARASASEDIPASYTACNSNISITVVAYGGSLSWTSRSSMTFKEGMGFDFSATTIKHQMNDEDSQVAYTSQELSTLDIYMGENANNLTKVDSAVIASLTSSDSINGKFYKLVDTIRGIESSATSVTNITFTAKATVELTANGGINTIEPTQVLYLKATISTTGWGGSLASTNPFTSSNTAVATVESTGKVTAVAVGTSTITVTLENGNTDTFEVTVQNKVTFTPEQMVKMLSENNITTNSYRYHNKANTAVTVYYRTEGYYKNDYIYQDSSMTGNNKVKLYGTATNPTGKSLTLGCFAVIKSLGFMYYGGDAEFNTYTIESITSPAVESFDITGASEVYKGEGLQLGVANFQPNGAEQTVTWSVNGGATITSAGLFTASSSGVYTVTATSTTSSAKAETHEIHVYEYKETALTLKTSPKTTYYTGQSVESDLVSAVVSYKCGNADYTPTSTPTVSLTTTYSYGGSSLTNATFNNKHDAATLTIASATVRLTLDNQTTKDFDVETSLSVSNVVVYDIEIDLDNTTISPSKTGFKFGEAFTHEGNIHIVYKNGYGSRDVALNHETVLVDEPDMEKLGTQTVLVVVDDTDYTGESLLEVGSYSITVTNVGSSMEYPAINVGNDIEDDYFYKGEMPENWTETNAGSNYTSHTPYCLKMDDTGDLITCTFPDKSFTKAKTIAAELYVKTIGGSSSSKFTVSALNKDGEEIPTGTIAFVQTNGTGTTQNAEVTCSASLTNNSGVEVYGIQFKFVKGSNVGVSGGLVQADATKNVELIESQALAMAEYLSEFKTCVSGWNSRNDIKTLVSEYNAMHDDAKTIFETLTITDYDWEKESEYNINTHTYGSGTASRNGVSAIQKLKDMVATYNSSLEQGEQQLVLNTPSGSFSSYSAISLGAIISSNSATLIIIIASIVSLAAIGGYFLFKKKRQ